MAIEVQVLAREPRAAVRVVLPSQAVTVAGDEFVVQLPTDLGSEAGGRPEGKGRGRRWRVMRMRATATAPASYVAPALTAVEGSYVVPDAVAAYTGVGEDDPLAVDVWPDGGIPFVVLDADFRLWFKTGIDADDGAVAGELLLLEGW